MKTFKDLLVELGACSEAKVWAGDMTIEEVVEKCNRGDWLLWLAKKVDVPLRPFTLAKARCAKTVLHLMKDQRSIDAVNLAEKFGLTDEVSEDDLRAAYAAAAAAAAAAYASAYAASAYAAYAYAYAAAAAAAADDAASYDAAWTKSQKQTADICKDTIGSLIISLVNQKIKQ